MDTIVLGVEKSLQIDAADDLCQQLVNEANQRDGSDNISAIVVTISEAAEG